MQTFTPLLPASSPRYAPHSHAAMATLTGIFCGSNPISPSPKKTSGLIYADLRLLTLTISLIALDITFLLKGISRL